MTRRGPSSRTRSTWSVPQTAVTVAPKCGSSCTAADPMAPVAPYTSAVRPSPTFAARIALVA